MVASEPPSVLPMSRRGSASASSRSSRVVVWIRGEHDSATVVHVSATLAQAAPLDDADVVVDLSGVTFMDASTIGALVDAHNRLRAGSRSLSVRAVPPRARRLFDVCELAFLIEEQPGPAGPPMAAALDSWVAVPASDRASDSTQPSPVTEPAPFQEEPARATAQPRGELAGSVQQRRALS